MWLSNQIEVFTAFLQGRGNETRHAVEYIFFFSSLPDISALLPESVWFFTLRSPVAIWIQELISEFKFQKVPSKFLYIRQKFAYKYDDILLLQPSRISFAGQRLLRERGNENQGGSSHFTVASLVIYRISILSM